MSKTRAKRFELMFVLFTSNL